MLNHGLRIAREQQPDRARVPQNRQGKTRLSKWYVPYDDDEKVRRLSLGPRAGECVAHACVRDVGPPEGRSAPAGRAARPEVPVELRRGACYPLYYQYRYMWNAC